MTTRHRMEQESLQSSTDSHMEYSAKVQEKFRLLRSLISVLARLELVPFSLRHRTQLLAYARELVQEETLSSPETISKSPKQNS